MAIEHCYPYTLEAAYASLIEIINGLVDTEKSLRQAGNQDAALLVAAWKNALAMITLDLKQFINDIRRISYVTPRVQIEACELQRKVDEALRRAHMPVYRFVAARSTVVLLTLQSELQHCCGGWG